VYVIPPGSQIGPITPEQRKALIAGSLVAGTYEKAVDRESAYEKIKGRTAVSGDAAAASPPAGAAGAPTPTLKLPGQTPAAEADGGLMGMFKDMVMGTTGPRGGKHAGLAEKAASSAVRSMGSAMGREIMRGVLGSLLGGSKRR
jgi:hypothetical protein